MRGTTRFMLSALAGLALLGSGAAAQAEYPDHPVRLVVPFAAGGGADAFVRLIQPTLEAELGQPLVVINSGQGGTVVGSRMVKDAKPDGYTVLVVHSAMHIGHLTGRSDFSYKDFEVVAGSTSLPLFVTVKADSPYQSLTELLDAAKDTPDTIIGGVNIGAVSHFASAMMADDHGSSFRFVQTGGAAPTVASLLGGHSVFGILTSSDLKPYYDSDTLRALAILSPERNPGFPDVPTAREQGTDVVFGVDYWWFMPKGSPQEAVDTFAAAVEATISNPEVQARLEELLIDPTHNSGEATMQQIEGQYSAIEGVAKSLGLSQ